MTVPLINVNMASGRTDEEKRALMAALTQAAPCGLQLGPGDAADVVGRPFAGALGFQRFGVLLGVW